MTERPSVAWTARILTIGTALSALLLGAAFVLSVLDLDGQATLLATLAVTILLATPAAGLLSTFVEVRRAQPSAAGLTLAVLALLLVATIVALLTRT
ncbi:MAG TPA: hypothetical protein VEX62_13900 [Candidatus Limnocylindrales bacterium]|nr:hypothetical protein [Candidatus Limnocylindrales bacterium]